MSTAFRRSYIVLSIGVITAFFGHAMWAVRGQASFVELVTGSMDNISGISVGAGTAENVVKTVGVVDIVLSVLMLAALIGFIRRSGVLYRFARSPVAIALYTWGVIWGFTTAVSRMSGAGVWYPEVWDVVERGPNFLLPAALVVMTLYLRTHEAERTTGLAPIVREPRPDTGVPVA